jgi:inactive STAND
VRSKRTNPWGDFVHTLCDRKRQAKQFYKFFAPNIRERSHLPQVYLLHGERAQRHGSLVQRLKIEQIEPYAVSEKGALDGSVHHITVSDVSPSDDLEAAKDDLLINLFWDVQFGYDPTRMSAQHFCDNKKFTPYPFVVIEHVFDVEKWDKTLSALIEWYLNTYWAEAISGTHKNQILLFLSFVYPDSVRPLWRRISPVKPFGKNAFNEFLQNLSIAVHKLYPCLLFDELDHLDQNEVCRSLGELGIHDDDDCPAWIENLFKKKRGRVSMREVETLIKSHLGLSDGRQRLKIS